MNRRQMQECVVNPAGGHKLGIPYIRIMYIM